MKIYTRAPRIKIGNTTYRFGKNGVSRSTKICKGVRIGTTATGKRYISGGRGIFRFYQDLDELDYDARTGNLKNQNPFGNGQQLSPAQKKQRQQQIQQARAQRQNDLSLGLLLAHPFVFFDHLFKRKKIQQIPAQQNSAKPLPSKANNTPKAVLPYKVDADIYKETSGVFNKVTEGNVSLDNEKIIIVANVTKEIFYKDISDVHIEKQLVLISSKGRNIPLALSVKNPEIFMMELCSRISS